MSVIIKTADEIAKMRVAGRLAAEVLEMIALTLSLAYPQASWIVFATTT